ARGGGGGGWSGVRRGGGVGGSQEASGREGSPRVSIRRFAQAKKAAAPIRSAISGSVSPSARREGIPAVAGRGRESSAAAAMSADQRSSWPATSGARSTLIQSGSRSSGADSSASTSSSRRAKAAALRAWTEAQ